MKTVGQMLHSGRQRRNLSLDQLSSLTKIDTKYIDALEQDRYHDLPSETFAKGFIRNLAQRLDLDPNELVAIFRRDFRMPDRERSGKPHRSLVFRGPNSQIWPFILGAAAFIIYLVFQFRAILTPPKLNILKPVSGSVLVSPIEIEGDTALDALIYINEETQAKPDSSGHFFARINFPVGEVTLEIKAVNRFGRTSEEKIPITVISK